MSLAVRTAASLQDLGEQAAATVLARLRVSPRPVLGVATGSSPLPLYQALAHRRADLPPLRAFALDEYLGLPAGHPQSYREVVRREVTEPLGLDPAEVFVPEGGTDDPDRAAAAYEDAIRAAGGIDVQVLGIGSNGHLAFNEPGSPLDSRTRVVDLDASTRQANARFFASPEEVPYRALTQGLGTILEAKALVLMAAGESKAEAVERALYGPVTPELPASVLQLHPDVTVLLAEGANSLLPRAAEANLR